MRIQNKLFLMLLLTNVLIVVILVGLLQWSMAKGMLEYVNKRDAEKLSPLIVELATLYERDNSWQALTAQPQKFRQLLQEQNILRARHKEDDASVEQNNLDSQFLTKKRRPRFKRLDIAVLNNQGEPLVSLNFRSNHRIGLPIEVNGNIVGRLSIPQRKEITEDFELRFLEQQQEMFILISCIVLLITVAVSLPLAWHFVRPIKKLNEGANILINGNYSLVLAENRFDELGELARNFNQLAKTLDETDNSRRHWLADISHELRTPLAILSGEIDAMLDGVRELSDDNLQSLKEEIGHLGKLIDDLYELTKADLGGLSYCKAEINIVELLAIKMKSYQPLFDEHGLQASWLCSVDRLIVSADTTRLHQLLDNVLMNSCRYTSRGGSVAMRLESHDMKAIITIEDSAPGVANDALIKIFDHLYRGESSRNRESGGSGLGLAICQRIVEAHNGTMKAEHSTLGGVAIIISLPLIQVEA